MKSAILAAILNKNGARLKKVSYIFKVGHYELSNGISRVRIFQPVQKLEGGGVVREAPLRH